MGRFVMLMVAVLMIAGVGGCGVKYPAAPVDMWPLGRREPVWKVAAENGVQFTAMAVSGEGKVFVARDDGKVLEWEIGAREAKRKFFVPESAEKWICAVAVSPDGRWLATASGAAVVKDGEAYSMRGGSSKVRVWDLRDGRMAAEAETEVGAHTRLHFSPDSKFLALVTDGYYVDLKVWETPQEVSRLKSVLMSNRHVDDVMLNATFVSDANSKLSLIALGRRWELGENGFGLKQQWESAAGVVVGERGYFAVGAEWDDRIYPWPVMTTPPGVLEQDLDGGKKRAYFKLPTVLGGMAEEKSLVFANVAEYRNGSGKARLVWGTILIDLSAGQFERLGCNEMEKQATFGLDVKGKEFGACGEWGFGVWYLP